MDYLTDYMNMVYPYSSLSSMMKKETKTIAEKTIHLMTLIKDVVRRNIYDPNYDRTMNTLLISYMLRNSKLIHTQVEQTKRVHIQIEALFADGSNEDVYLETTVLGIASELTSPDYPEDLFMKV